MEYFVKDQIIFLQGRVGVITHGSVKVRSHQGGILTPTIVGRYKEGRILGHGSSDNNITVQSNTWLTSFDEGTEIVFIDKARFDELWRHQALRTQHMLLANSLSTNELFRHLSEQTINHLVFNVI